MNSVVRSGAGGSASREGGFALAIVVWFIAGMSLLVSGIVATSRTDTHMAQLHVARAKAAAVGDGAIQLMMAEWVAGRIETPIEEGLPNRRFRLGELDAEVTLVPAAGLVDLNSASGEVLAALFTLAAGLDAGEAQTVADNVVKWRSSKTGSRGRSQGFLAFTAIEDLLRVDGVSRTLLDAVRDYVVAGLVTRGGDASLSPELVLEVLALSNPKKAEALRRKRALAGPSRPGSRAVKGGIGSGPFRADARIRYGDRTWLRRRWLDAGSDAGSMLSWRSLRNEPPRVIYDS